jgi:regulatory protein
MKIIKYQKLSGNKYNVYLDNGEKIKLYEDIIIKEELLLKKEIDDVDRIIKLNDKYSIYEVSLKYISTKIRSIKEMEDYLTKKGYSNLDINNTIDKLIKKGYLNDDYYSKCYISDKINLSNDGPLKIKKHLEELGIPYPVYSKYLKDFNYSLQKEKVNDYINKKLKSNRKSRYMFKNSIIVNLVNLGYDKELVNECLYHVYVDDKDNLNKEKEKIRKKLEKKYSGDELEYKIKQKLYQKGYFE